jgi:hypothetical protein
VWGRYGCHLLIRILQFMSYQRTLIGILSNPSRSTIQLLCSQIVILRDARPVCSNQFLPQRRRAVSDYVKVVVIAFCRQQALVPESVPDVTQRIPVILGQWPVNDTVTERVKADDVGGSQSAWI